MCRFSIKYLRAYGMNFGRLSAASRLILDSLPGSASHPIAGGGCDSGRFRAALKAKGITPSIPPIKSRKRPLACDKTLYKTRLIDNVAAG